MHKSISNFVLQNEEDDVLKRDYTAPTLEDHFDKTILPKVMQVTVVLLSLFIPANNAASIHYAYVMHK